MEYVFPKRFKINKEDENKARKVYERLIWFMLGNITATILLKILALLYKK